MKFLWLHACRAWSRSTGGEWFGRCGRRRSRAAALVKPAAAACLGAQAEVAGATTPRARSPSPFSARTRAVAKPSPDPAASPSTRGPTRCETHTRVPHVEATNFVRTSCTHETGASTGRDHTSEWVCPWRAPVSPPPGPAGPNYFRHPRWRGTCRYLRCASPCGGTCGWPERPYSAEVCQHPGSFVISVPMGYISN